MQKDYNNSLRSTILICSIRCEEASSDVIRLVLRHVKNDSKTLGNKSSSLSFKNKIDILYDLDELNKNQYGEMIKFMEIRNQFIHNPKCNRFLNLKEENRDLTNYLNKYYLNENDNEETNLNQSFSELFKSCLGKLLVLKMEYRKGYTQDLSRFINNHVVKNLNEIIERTNKSLIDENKEKPIPLAMMGIDSSQRVESFVRLLKHHIAEKSLKVLRELEEKDQLEKIFHRKVSVEEIFKQIEENN